VKELPWDTWSLFNDTEYDALKSGQTVTKTYDRRLWDTKSGENGRGEHPFCIPEGYVFMNTRKPGLLDGNLTPQPQLERMNITVIRVERTQGGKGTKRRRYNYTYTFKLAEKANPL
jgi:hypothetical protein